MGFATRRLKTHADIIMNTSIPPSNLNLDLYEAEDSNHYCFKITKFYRKNKPFIYEFKDTEGNNHTLEIVFTHVDDIVSPYVYDEDDERASDINYNSQVWVPPKPAKPDTHTAIHFNEEARLRRLALKAFEIYKESDKVVLINPDRALDSLDLAEEWWNEERSKQIKKNNLRNFLIPFKTENPNFPITVVNYSDWNPYILETEEILKFARFIGAEIGQDILMQKKKNQLVGTCFFGFCTCKIDTSKCDFEANYQNDKRTFIRKDLSGIEHELQIDDSDCKYQEHLKTEALAKQSFRIYKQGGPVIIIDPNFALGTKEAAEKWYEMKKKQNYLDFLVMGIAGSFCLVGQWIYENIQGGFYDEDTMVGHEILKLAGVYILLSLMPVVVFWIVTKCRERAGIEIDGQKYSAKEFRIY